MAKRSKTKKTKKRNAFVVTMLNHCKGGVMSTSKKKKKKKVEEVDDWKDETNE